MKVPMQSGAQLSPLLTIGNARRLMPAERGLTQANQSAFGDAIEIAFAMPNQLDDVLRQDRTQSVGLDRYTGDHKTIPCMIEG